jgi:hypothetical protein
MQVRRVTQCAYLVDKPSGKGWYENLSSRHETVLADAARCLCCW